MRIFVTGGTGFVGSHLVEVLVERGHEVRCLVRDEAKAACVLGGSGPELVPGGLDDAGALRRGCAGAEAVVHVAGLTAALTRGHFFRVNADGTRAVVEAARQVGGERARFVHVSSLAASGPTTRGRRARESDAPKPVSGYGASKLAGEEAVRSSRLAWTILRPPAVYGPRDRAFLPFFKLARRGWVPLFGDGSQELSLVYVRDLAGAIACCVEREPAGRVYHAAHSDTCTARELVASIARSVGGREGSGAGPRVIRIPRLAVRPLLWACGAAARLAGRATMLSRDKAGEILAEAWTCSSEDMERDTGWRAETPLAAGLRATADWYRGAGWLSRAS